MVSFMLLAIVGALLLGLIVIVLYGWGVYDAVWGGEDYETSAEAVSVIAQEIILSGKEGGVLYDLGSCRGSFAIQLARQLPRLKIIGIDNSPFRVMLSRARGQFAANRPTFLLGDLFDLDTGDADVVNVFLPDELATRAYRKICELGKDVMVIKYKTPLSKIEPTKVIPLAGLGELVSIYHTASYECHE